MEERIHRDRALVRRLLAGDELAFAEFFDGHTPRLYRFALTRVGQDADIAEEVVQATLMRVFAKLRTYRGEAPLFTWLCTFCRREISAFFKAAKRRQTRETVVADLQSVGTPESLRDGRPDPEDRTVEREVAEQVRKTLDSLPDHYGQVLELKYIQELSVKEIAEQMAVGPVVVQSTLARARRAFRDAFGPVTPVLARVRRADV